LLTTPTFSSSCAFSLERLPELVSLGFGQIRGLGLVIEIQQPNLLIRQKTIVDNAQTAAFPFAPPRILPTQLADASRRRHQIAGFRIVHQCRLKLGKSIIVEIVLSVARECRCLNELEHPNIGRIAHWTQVYPIWV
jgi:hypothetical protein